MFEYEVTLLSEGNIWIRHICAGNAIIITFFADNVLIFYTFNVLLLTTLIYTKHFHP